MLLSRSSYFVELCAEVQLRRIPLPGTSVNRSLEAVMNLLRMASNAENWGLRENRSDPQIRHS